MLDIERLKIRDFFLQSTIHQEMGLRYESGDAGSAVDCRSGQRGKIHPGRQILDAGQDQGIVVRVMAKMTPEPAVAAIRRIIFLSRHAIIENKYDSLAKAMNQVRHPGPKRQADLRRVVIGEPAADVFFNVAYSVLQVFRRIFLVPYAATWVLYAALYVGVY